MNSYDRLWLSVASLKCKTPTVCVTCDTFARYTISRFGTVFHAPRRFRRRSLHPSYALRSSSINPVQMSGFSDDHLHPTATSSTKEAVYLVPSVLTSLL